MIGFRGFSYFFLSAIFLLISGCASGTQEITDSFDPVAGGVDVVEQAHLESGEEAPQLELMSEQEIESAFLSTAEGG